MVRINTREGMERNVRKSKREIEREIFKLTNKERRKHGLAELELTPYLIHAAREHSKDMIRRHFFSHMSYVGDDEDADEGPMKRVRRECRRICRNTSGAS